MTDQATTTASPENLLVRFSGTAFLDQALNRDQGVHVTVTTEDGENVANGFGTVEEIRERTHKNKTTVDRVFMVKVS